MTCETVYTDRHERENTLVAAHTVENYLWQKALDKKYGRATKVSPDVTQTLLALAKDKEWWPKLFVLGMLAQNEELRDAAIVAAVKSDMDDLVKKALIAIAFSKITSEGTDQFGPGRGERVIQDPKQIPAEHNPFRN